MVLAKQININEMNYDYTEKNIENNHKKPVVLKNMLLIYFSFFKGTVSNFF